MPDSAARLHVYVVASDSEGWVFAFERADLKHGYYWLEVPARAAEEFQLLALASFITTRYFQLQPQALQQSARASVQKAVLLALRTRIRRQLRSAGPRQAKPRAGK